MNPQTTTHPPRGQTLVVPGFVLHLGVHPAGSALPRHVHEDPTICCVLRGGFTEYSSGRSDGCGPATLKVMPAGEPHWDRFGSQETRGVRLDVDRTRFAEEPALYRALGERHHQTHRRAGELVRRLAVEMGSSDTARAVAVEALALEVVVDLARSGPSREGRGVPRWLLDAESIVRAQYRSRLSVGAIAREVAIHPATLSRAYRRRLGHTIGEHIRRLRIEHAARELLETGDPPSAIALRAGFYDQSHFTNVFRRMLGITPAAYRTRAGA